MDLSTKKGKYQWYIITKPKPGWGLTEVTVENADKLMDLFKNCIIQFGLNSIMNTPTTGTGPVKTVERTIVSADHWNKNLSDYKKNMTQVRALSGCFMGENLSSLATPINMNIKAINPNVPGNLGLVNQYSTNGTSSPRPNQDWA